VTTTRKYGPNPGAITLLCPCGSRMTLSQASCAACWQSVPLTLRQAWISAKGAPAGERDAVRDQVRDHLRRVS
jgi:hypothetical protein